MTDPLFLPASQLAWPSGAHLMDPPAESLAAELSRDPWIDFKLRAGRWYIAALMELEAAIGAQDLDRFAGVEMALDGAFANISGAVDAAVFRLVRAIEKQVGAVPTQDHSVKGATLISLKKKHPLVVKAPSIARLSAATVRDPTTQDGWLTVMRDLRNRTTHQASLMRTYEIGAVNVQSGLTIPGRQGPVPPVSYLEDCLTEASHLSADLITDAVATGHMPPFR